MNQKNVPLRNRFAILETNDLEPDISIPCMSEEKPPTHSKQEKNVNARSKVKLNDVGHRKSKANLKLKNKLLKSVNKISKKQFRSRRVDLNLVNESEINHEFGNVSFEPPSKKCKKSSEKMLCCLSEYNLCNKESSIECKKIVTQARLQQYFDVNINKVLSENKSWFCNEHYRQFCDRYNHCFVCLKHVHHKKQKFNKSRLYNVNIDEKDVLVKFCYESQLSNFEEIFTLESIFDVLKICNKCKYKLNSFKKTCDLITENAFVAYDSVLHAPETSEKLASQSNRCSDQNYTKYYRTCSFCHKVLYKKGHSKFYKLKECDYESYNMYCKSFHGYHVSKFCDIYFCKKCLYQFDICKGQYRITTPVVLDNSSRSFADNELSDGQSNQNDKILCEPENNLSKSENILSEFENNVCESESVIVQEAPLTAEEQELPHTVFHFDTLQDVIEKNQNKKHNCVSFCSTLDCIHLRLKYVIDILCDKFIDGQAILFKDVYREYINKSVTCSCPNCDHSEITIFTANNLEKYIVKMFGNQVIFSSIRNEPRLGKLIRWQTNNLEDTLHRHLFECSQLKNSVIENDKAPPKRVFCTKC